MALCVEVHYISAGTNLKVDGVGYTDPTYGIGTYALLPSKTQTEVNCTGYLLHTVGETVGFFDGVTLEDSIEVSWGVVLVLVMAYCFKQMRRPIR
jgi:hypothetical protein